VGTAGAMATLGCGQMKTKEDKTRRSLKTQMGGGEATFQNWQTA
jgi:hypothetical protein